MSDVNREAREGEFASFSRDDLVSIAHAARLALSNDQVAHRCNDSPLLRYCAACSLRVALNEPRRRGE